MASKVGSGDTDSAALLQCYNRSCGVKFDPAAADAENACIHHPGHPVFHDAYKSWSCCGKKTTDFTEFLNAPGCTRGFHCNVKPPEPEKCATTVKVEEKFPTPVKPLAKPAKRPSFDSPLIERPIHAAESLAKILASLALEPGDPITPPTLAEGQPCLNKTCRKSYSPTLSLEDRCVYHSGDAIFHEGLKYWTCCVKRTSDFDAFLEQVGCTTGKHKWALDAEEKADRKRAACRVDWYQTGSHVFVTLFSKATVPDRSTVRLGPVRLQLSIYFDNGKSHFIDDFALAEEIDPTLSTVSATPSKLEIKLKKATVASWKSLRHDI